MNSQAGTVAPISTTDLAQVKRPHIFFVVLFGSFVQAFAQGFVQGNSIEIDLSSQARGVYTITWAGGSAMNNARVVR